MNFNSDEYLAKSNPIETLEEHTLLLLDNMNIFFDINQDLEVDKFLLKKAIIYHDIGKVNEKFQNKIRGIKNKDEEIPHGHISVGFINLKTVFEGNEYTNDEIKKWIDNYDLIRKKILIASIYYHHDRSDISIFPDEIKTKIDAELEILREKAINFKSNELRDIKVHKFPSSKYFYFDLDDLSEKTNVSGIERKKSRITFKNYAIIKGLLNKIDYASSAHELVDIKNDFLESYMDDVLDSFRKKNSNADWNDLQKFMIENRDSNVIAVAQTGMGKTEAGLLWIGNNKGFFTLPLKTAINSIYDRIRLGMKGDISKKVSLLHSDMSSRYLSIKDENYENLNLEEYITRTRQFSMPLTICTVDQILDFVYKYNGCEIKMATLSYSKLIIDEIQMYSPEILAAIILALEWIVDLGGKFSILTATLPPFILDELNKRDIKIKQGIFLNNKIRHSLKIIDDSIYADFISEKFDDNKVLVICNTVKQAQKIYKELKTDENLSEKTHIFHSSFIKRDRDFIESEILNFTKKENNESGIWICTQVVEASLDVDFDLLITELSDINGLFQRLGRCYRNRTFEKEGYNCYLFNGGDGKTSGVGSDKFTGVIEETIFNLSKDAIKNIDGKLTEQTKQDLINEVYSSDNIKKTLYYKEYQKKLEYIENLYRLELTKNDAIDRMREIKSIDIIPKVVYEEFEEELDKAFDVLLIKSKDIDSDEEKNKIKEEKIRAREFISSLSVSIPLNVFMQIKASAKEYIKKSHFQHLVVVDINYSKKYGLEKENSRNIPTDILDRLI